jgi:hypothetical protein
VVVAEILEFLFKVKFSPLGAMKALPASEEYYAAKAKKESDKANVTKLAPSAV